MLKGVILQVDKILVVEDCRLFRLQIRKALEENGFSNVLELGNADLVSRTPQLYLKDVNLIILDVELPGISGINLANQLKEDPIYCNIPIIFISGNSDVKVVHAAINAGGIDYIAKPIKFDLLVKRIEKVMDNFYGNLKGNNEYIKAKIMDVIINEYERATRAGTALGFLIFGLENKDLEKASYIIKKSMRIIDSVLIMEDRIIVVLPLTEEGKLTIVVNKIQEKILQNDMKIVLQKSFSFEPSSQKKLEDLKKELFEA